MERHEKSLHHPYYFEESHGLPHVFEEPKQKVLTSKEIEDERRRILHAAENIWS